MKLLITGGAGFIGSNLVRMAIEEGHDVLNLDKLTYAGNPSSLSDIRECGAYRFVQGDICDHVLLERLLGEFAPDCILHLAAESHVDRSIDGPEVFIQTNVMGTFRLLEAARHYWRGLPEEKRERFRFLHVSTDEVFGSLGPEGHFSENTPYDPRSPYSASKASSDHLARAYYHTYGLPTVVTNCSNNYGPFQFPEKLIPLMINNAIRGQNLPVYGDGGNIRDWLYVGDHCSALLTVLRMGKTGETYTIGGNSERTNLQIVTLLCGILDELYPGKDGKSFSELITFVPDRPGHDRRYAIDAAKIQRELGWKPRRTFEEGMRTTVQWYLDNQDWVENVLSGKYQMERLGVTGGLDS